MKNRIYWVIEDNVIHGNRFLNDMFIYLEKNELDMFHFIRDNCKHLLTLPKNGEETGFTSNIVDNPEYFVNLKQYYSPYYLQDYKNKAGVYCFASDTNKIVYIGSTSNLHRRLQYYYMKYSDIIRDVRNNVRG